MLRRPSTPAWLPALAACAALFGCAPAAVAPAAPVTPQGVAPTPSGPSLSAAEKIAIERITAAEISGHTRFLADDLLEGRFPGARGDELAARYLATELETMGYKPGATGPDGKPSWFQTVPLMKFTTAVPPEVVFDRGAQKLALKTGPGVAADLVFRSIGAADRVKLDASELVFVGYGISAPERGWDDYKGVDVRGKIAVILNFNPPFAGEGVRLWVGRWDYKYMEAARHGAAGALMIHTTQSAGYPWQVVATSNRAESFALPPEDDKDPRLGFQGWITHDAAAKLFAMGGRDLAADEAAAKDPKGHGAKGAPLGVTAALDLAVAHQRIESANVVGVFPGTDPRLAGEAVLYTAHHDHLGVRNPPKPGERNVFAGALDNASGCAAVLTIARAMAAAPPRRSVIVAFVTAEEQGLLGSKWFAAHPPVRRDRIAVDLNVDGINNGGRTRDVGFLGLGRSKDVDAVVLALAAAQGRTVHGDPFPDRGHFYRSDDFELARVGVPGARVTGGPSFVGRPEGWGKEQRELYERHDYHQPTDTYPPSPASWDLTGAVEDAQLQYLIGRRIGDAEKLPAWTPGDEFEKARLSVPQ
jgi:Zn-dependent M28 family amino/carboxypeptidase